MSNIAPLPPGFQLLQEAPPQTRQASAGGVAPLPPGFVLQGAGEAPQGAPEASGGVGGAVRAIGRGVLGVGTFLDEANAATNAALAPIIDPLLPDSFEKLSGATYGERYDQALEIQRRKDREYDEANPYTSTALQVAGGVGSGGALLRAAPTAARTALGMNGTTGLGQVATGAASGLGFGAVQGFGAGEDGLANRATEARNGAILGAGMGAAAVPVGAAVGAGVNAVAGRIAGSGGPLSGRAARLVRNDLTAEGTDIGAVGAKAQAIGDDAMLADASEMLRLRTEQIANSPVSGRTGVIDAMRERSSGARERIGSAYDATMGQTPDVQATLDDILTRRAADAAPLYEQAMRQPVVMDERLARFVNDPIMKRGVERGFEIQRMEAVAKGEEFNPVDYRIILEGPDGQPKMQDVPNMRTLQTAKVGLDALITDSKDQFGRLTERGRAINQFRMALLRQLDESNPTYAKARAAWEGPTRTLDAFENGRTIFGNKLHPDTLKRDIGQMSEAEREAYQLGTRAAVDEAMGRVRNGALKGRQLLDSDFNERRILTVFGDEEGKRLIATLNGEEAMAQTANQTLGNSATARRMQGNPFTGRDIDVNSVPQSLYQAGRLVAQRGANAVAGGSRDRLGAELAPVLTARGAERDALLEALIDSEKRRGSARTRAPDRQALARALIQGGSLAYGQNALR